MLGFDENLHDCDVCFEAINICSFPFTTRCDCSVVGSIMESSMV